MRKVILAVPFGTSARRITGDCGSKHAAVPVQSTAMEKARACPAGNATRAAQVARILSKRMTGLFVKMRALGASNGQIAAVDHQDRAGDESGKIGDRKS